MREMVLNHASLLAPDQHTAVEWLKGMVTGMVVLVGDGIVQKTLRMSQPLHEPTVCLTGRFGCSPRIAERPGRVRVLR